MFSHRPDALSHLPQRHARASLSVAAAWVDSRCLDLLARGLAGVPVRLALWNGTARAAAEAAPLATIQIRDRPTLWRLLWNPDMGFGEAYATGRLLVEGDLVGVLTEISIAAAQSPPTWFRRLRGRGGAAIARATTNVRHHYDLGNDFYRRWLDGDLVYTCAYFAAPELSLEDAQRAKLELVARKLALQRGDRVIEAGCGWGALALYLARTRGVSVRAWNVSREQIEWARERARAEGLARQVEFIEGDYRTIEGSCDAFVSVGMLEHVGAAHYETLGEVIDRTLDRTHGRGLLHFIGRNAPAPMSQWITRRIFPGAYIPSLREVLSGVVEPRGWSVVDVENLRRHYALTLAHWLERFEGAAADISRERGETFTRMWRLYLAEAQAGFRAGNLQLFQVTFARHRDDGLPWTRAALYEPMEPIR
jgi:cyclopropane-fatty-acyl-phospholipid synthase